ncbi:MAG: pyridoxal phosphate-dependent aminotransferase [Lentimicrobiaceae bacterium]|nr:pyridoxal phosphate-dependent aminotransferase [Lentimicrobiaceae bacterium]
MNFEYKNTPVPAEVVKKNLQLMGLSSVGKASIREIKRLVDNIERDSGVRYVRMEMGVPGLVPTEIGTNAEIAALKKGVAAVYPDIDGIPELKTEISRFVKNFIDVDVSPSSCIPTVGSMQASFALFLTLNRMSKEKDTTLFIDPGFPVHKQQHRVLGQKFESFDVYNFRGEKLRGKLEEYLSKGNVHSILYSNPNNPSWVCLTDDELKIIGELANKYNVIVLEDLAYFAMDFRKDYGQPGKPPYQPSVAKYTDNYVMLISSSKAFSYAGQRIGVMVISDKLFNTESENLVQYFGNSKFGRAIVFGTVYSLSSGTAHSAQYALAAMLKATNDGVYNFRDDVIEYGEKARIMKKLFTDNGFKIVYDKDLDEPVADGFYFTISYPGLSGEQLIEALIYYGVSAISLRITGSERTEGLRACVSLVYRDQFPDLEKRLIQFNKDFKN